MFAANVRSSGASLAYQISAMVSGITPFATTLLGLRFGWAGPAGLFAVYSLLGLGAALLTDETWTKDVRARVARATEGSAAVASRPAPPQSERT